MQYVSFVLCVTQVARQLFKPLLSQLIHWFTSSQMHSNPATAVLLDTIMVGLIVLFSFLCLSLLVLSFSYASNTGCSKAGCTIEIRV